MIIHDKNYKVYDGDVTCEVIEKLKKGELILADGKDMRGNIIPLGTKYYMKLLMKISMELGCSIDDAAEIEKFPIAVTKYHFPEDEE